MTAVRLLLQHTSPGCHQPELQRILEVSGEISRQIDDALQHLYDLYQDSVSRAPHRGRLGAALALPCHLDQPRHSIVIFWGGQHAQIAEVMP